MIKKVKTAKDILDKKVSTTSIPAATPMLWFLLVKKRKHIYTTNLISYYLRVTIIVIKKAKIVKVMLDKKVLITGISAAASTFSLQSAKPQIHIAPHIFGRKISIFD